MRRVLGRSYALNVQLSSQPSTARSSPALEDGKPLLVVGARKKEKKNASYPSFHWHSNLSPVLTVGIESVGCRTR